MVSQRGMTLGQVNHQGHYLQEESYQCLVSPLELELKEPVTCLEGEIFLRDKHG